MVFTITSRGTMRELKKPATYLTLLRIVITGLNYYAVLHRNIPLFIILFSLAGVTDALDGIVARRRKEATSAGARFDSFADYVLYVSMVVWMFMLVPEIFALAAVQIFFFMIAVYLILKVLIREKACLHLWPSKLAAVGAYAFVIASVTLGFEPVMLYVLLFIVGFAIAYELHFVLWRNA